MSDTTASPAPGDTIAAIATAAGGGIGIVRLSGPDALAIAERASGRPLPRSGSLRRRQTASRDGETLDDGLLVVFRAPRSLTGEDVAEFHGHGGAQTLGDVLDLFLSLGARLALPGEFTERAFLAGKLDLTQAEAVADLVAARSADARRAALRQLSGGLKRSADGIGATIQSALAFLEASIDFPEEVGEPDAPVIERTLRQALDTLASLLAGARRGRALTEGVQLALIGRPNAGKSSLLNALAGTERAIVTEIPGTTRDIVSADLTIGGFPVCALDTAGLRETLDPIEAIGVARAREAAQSADVVLIVADATVGIGDEERALLATYPDRAVLLANKCDLAPAPDGALAVSARTGLGLDALGTQVAALLGSADATALPLVTRARHEDALRRTARSVEQALVSLAQAQPPELVAVDCHGALQSLGELTGETSRAEVIEGIFRTFCLGK